MAIKINQDITIDNKTIIPDKNIIEEFKQLGYIIDQPEEPEVPDIIKNEGIYELDIKITIKTTIDIKFMDN